MLSKCLGKFTIILTLFLGAGCGVPGTDWWPPEGGRTDRRTKTPSEYAVTVDPALRVYFDSFVADLESYGVETLPGHPLISIEITPYMPGSLEKISLVGLCQRMEGESPHARILILTPGKWGRSPSAIEIRQVFYHEMGHCWLNLGHGVQGSGSIMQPSLSSYQYWIESNWDALVSNLMTGSELPSFNERDLRGMSLSDLDFIDLTSDEQFAEGETHAK